MARKKGGVVVKTNNAAPRMVVVQGALRILLITEGKVYKSYYKHQPLYTFQAQMFGWCALYSSFGVMISDKALSKYF